MDSSSLDTTPVNNIDGLWIIDKKRIPGNFIACWVLALPLFGGLLWVVLKTSIVPLIFLITGYSITGLLFAFFLLNKQCYFWQLASGFVSILYILGLGSWLIFTGYLAKSLERFAPIHLTVALSFLFFSAYGIMFFMKYYRNFVVNEKMYLQGLDSENGIINPRKTKFYKDKLGTDEIGKSPMTLPLRLFVLFVAPIGAGGCGLLMRHTGASLQLIILAMGMYVLTIGMIAGGMHGYFSLFILAKLQIKYRKWFCLASS